MIRLFIFGVLIFSINTFSCPKGKHRVREHFRKGSKVNSYCRKNPSGYKIWHEWLSNSNDKSVQIPGEENIKWKESEIKLLLSVFEKLPNLISKQSIKGVKRNKKSKEHPNDGAYLKEYIFLYDNSFNSEENLKNILIHEISHFIWESLSDVKKEKYLKKFRWFKLEGMGKSIWLGRKDGYVEVDGSLSPDEDFANNIEYFFSNPQKLKKITPLAYKWIKENL